MYELMELNQLLSPRISLLHTSEWGFKCYDEGGIGSEVCYLRMDTYG